ncbi:MAG: hypothetical protein AAFV53_22035 [Myxococcota bacterium]
MSDRANQTEDEPRGLMALLTWPLQAGLALFAALVQGIIGALFGETNPPDDPEAPSGDAPSSDADFGV